MLFKNKFVAQLSEEQKAALKELQGQGYTARIGTRAEAILLSARGYTIDEISRITDSHRVTVAHWLTHWNERGIDGLLEREGRGRKRSLTEAEERQVVEWLREDPRSTKNLVLKIEAVLGKSVSLDTVKRLIKRHGKVWKRVRSRPAGQPDEEEFRQCEQELVEHMEAAVNGEIDLFYLDQSGFGRTPYISYAWQDQGSTLRVPCREGKRINVMGLFSLMAGTVRTEMTTENITSAQVVSFLESFSETLDKFTVVALDNASIHTAKAVIKKLPEWENKNLYLYFLPTYSPELNLIEILWRQVKYKWLPWQAYASFESLWSSLKHIFSEIGVKYKLYFA
jgi:transposase